MRISGNIGWVLVDEGSNIISVNTAVVVSSLHVSLYIQFCFNKAQVNLKVVSLTLGVVVTVCEVFTL